MRHDKYILDADGRPLFERVHEAKLLPAPNVN